MAMPARLGRYVVVRRVGSGGFATVWLAYDDQLDSPVAVKVLADNWTTDAHIRARFTEEGRYLRKVESPHVVSVYDAGELDDGRPYLVMTYADQGTLADRLEIDGLTPAQSMEVVRQVAAGLQALHDADIVHRDVKPANVLFRTTSDSNQLRAMVGDLGLGKALGMSSRLTMVAGTPNFVAPEQARAESPDARADQFSLAALAYLLLTGRPPFDRVGIADALEEAAYTSVSGPERSFAEEVDQVLARGLAFDRAERFASVTEFAEALAAALGEDNQLGPGPWLPVDTELTQPGVRPTVPVAAGVFTAVGPPISAEVEQTRRAGWAVTLAAGVAGAILVAGAGVGAWAVSRNRAEPAVAASGTTTLTDSTGVISVTVPTDWTAARNLDGWKPHRGEARLPAISTGTTPDWTTDGDGTFLGLVDATRLPDKVPGHPTCTAQDPVEQSSPASILVIYTDCPSSSGHGTVIAEQVIQVATNRILWVQVRAESTAQAYQVIDSVVSRI